MLRVELTAWRIALASFAFVFGTTIASADDTGLENMHDIVKSGGHSCFASHTHMGQGDGATKPAAMAAAIKAWWEYTAGEYGSDWAHWGRSAAKKVTYTKADKGWTATVESRPCK
jgi:hypothetical protein